MSFDVTHCGKASLASVMLLRLVVGGVVGYFDPWEWHVCSSVVICVSTRFEGGLTRLVVGVVVGGAWVGMLEVGRAWMRPG